jgi:hypothetical protein
VPTDTGAWLVRAAAAGSMLGSEDAVAIRPVMPENWWCWAIRRGQWGFRGMAPWATKIGSKGKMRAADLDRIVDRSGFLWTAALALILGLAGCAGAPRQTESLDYQARAETLEEGRVRVSAVVLSPLESEQTFALPLAKKRIQPVWLEIANDEDHDIYLMLLGLDPDYFTPSEVAWQFKSHGSENFQDKTDRLLAMHVPVVIQPQSSVSGYVYTNLDPGAKGFAVQLFGPGYFRSFEFAQLVPGFEADFMRVDFDAVYAESEFRQLGIDELPAYLEQLPCCVAGGDRKTPGDPLNLVIVGDARQAISVLISRGWDLTETMRGDSTWRTTISSLFGSKYRTSPISPLYLFDRPQDIALQKTRGSVDERNHLRLWLAPITVDGKHLWVGQISRDIGVKLSSKTFITHKIDAVVDEARLYITLDLASSQSLCALGYVKGVGRSGREAPRYNYTRDPYYTDGLRVVLVLGDARYAMDELEFLPWEQPPLIRDIAIGGKADGAR